MAACAIGDFHRARFTGKTMVTVGKGFEAVAPEAVFLRQLDRRVAGRADLRRYVARSYGRQRIFGGEDVVFAMTIGARCRGVYAGCKRFPMDTFVELGFYVLVTFAAGCRNGLA